MSIFVNNLDPNNLSKQKNIWDKGPNSRTYSTGVIWMLFEIIGESFEVIDGFLSELYENIFKLFEIIGESFDNWVSIDNLL